MYVGLKQGGILGKGRLVRLRRAAESEWQQNEYCKRRKCIFCAQHVSKNWFK